MWATLNRKRCPTVLLRQFSGPSLRNAVRPGIGGANGCSSELLPIEAAVQLDMGAGDLSTGPLPTARYRESREKKENPAFVRSSCLRERMRTLSPVCISEE